MKIYPCLLVIHFVRQNSAWICSGVLKGACDANEAEERCFVLYDNEYTNPLSTETHYVKQRLGCSALCLTKKCACFLQFPDMKCLLMFTEGSIPENSHILRLMGKNVAVGKTNSASSELTASYKADNIVDGKVASRESGNEMYHSSSASPVWLQIDLGDYFKIRTIRLIASQASTSYNLKDVKVYISNSTIVGNDVSGHYQVGSITEIKSTYGWWYSLTLNLAVPYRYVVIYKSVYYITMDEVEVLA